jgi:hypothetical protein
MVNQEYFALLEKLDVNAAHAYGDVREGATSPARIASQ